MRLVSILLAGVAMLASPAGPAFAQGGYPGKPIRLMVPFTPGGGTDLLARIVAQKMSEQMGQQVIVDNKPGGNTLVATQELVRSAPDGYTLLMQTNNLAANPTLYKGKLQFDTLKDMTPVALVAGNPHVLVVNPSVPVNTLQEYIALAKAKPGTVTFATAGSGTVNHLTGELLKIQAGIDIVHVPYKGSGSVMPDLLGGQVNSLFAAMPTVTGFIKEKKLRAIAVTTPTRFRGLPDVPTIRRVGLSRLRLQLMVRHPRARRHAEADRRPAERRDRQGLEGYRRAVTPRRLRDLRIDTGGVRHIHPERDRQDGRRSSKRPARKWTDEARPVRCLRRAALHGQCGVRAAAIRQARQDHRAVLAGHRRRHRGARARRQARRGWGRVW
jgi:tripartite-type tricarboxylate transporter receptor subunit TctC